jgi:glycosyltransferase involved in cell wall biosynthesis
VDLEVFRPGEKAADPLLLWVGRIRKTKCVDHVVEAFARIADRVPAARLVIVGRGEMEADLRRLIEQRGLTGRVQLTGYVQTDRLRELMQQAWVLAYPSPKEGWGLCVIEAAACGTPSVASNVPGLCESVSDGKTGFLVPHGDIGALAERIERLLTDPNQRSAMGMAARQWATGFSWERTAAESMAVLQRTVRREW